jgi:uncharacterized protein YkwD
MFRKILLKFLIIFTPCKENDYRPKFLESNFLLYYLIFLLLLKIITFSVLVHLPNTIFFADISHSSLIRLTNEERGLIGISSLRKNELLNQAAYLKAQDMINHDYFSHESPLGVTPWHWFSETGYDYNVAGENLGIGFLDSEEIYLAWDNSPSHKANLINPKYEDIGICVLKGDFNGSQTTIVVQLFGALQKQAVKTSPKEEIKKEEEEPKPEQEEVVYNTEEIDQKMNIAGLRKEVLGETYIEQSTEKKEQSFKFKFFEFMALNYNNIVQQITFYSLLFIVLCLFINIFVKFNVQHKYLIFKIVIFVCVLILFILLNKSFIIQLIPHNLGIY